MAKIKEATEHGILTKIALENTTIDEKYDRWLTEVSRIIDEASEVRKEKNQKILKIERKLNTVKKAIKKKQWSRNDKKSQIRLINQLIENEIRQEKATTTMKIAKTIYSEKKMHSGSFYEFKQKIDRREKGETPSAMVNKEGKECYEREEIREIFQDFYQELFQKEEPINETEKKAMEITENVFLNIMEEAEKPKRKEQIDEETVKKCLRELKNKSSLDYNNISNKILKNAGKDMIDSLTIIFKEIDNSNHIPTAWEDMIIKSIYKGKNSKKEMDNRRGLFITSVVSKLFEKTKLSSQREKIENQLSKFQTGGVKGKSPIDNKMVLNATIDYNNFINSETYVFFADAYKCFDKIDLKTSLVDLYEMLGAHETKLVYEMNKKATITVKTPVGNTNPIRVKEISTDQYCVI